MNVLKHHLHGNMVLIFTDDLFTEILLKVLADYKDKLSETATDGIKDRIIHDSLSVGTQSVKLLQATVTASHTGSQYK